MTRTYPFRSIAIAGACVALAGSIALGDEKPPTVALSNPDPPARVLRPTRSRAEGSSTDSSAGWWLGPAGFAAALAVFGGVSLASKRFLPNRETSAMQVVGRSSLSPKHSVYLLRVGDRVLILGAGPQGPPATLGEVTDPDELARLIPRRTTRLGFETPVAPARPAPTAGFDRRIGDDE